MMTRIVPRLAACGLLTILALRGVASAEPVDATTVDLSAGFADASLARAATDETPTVPGTSFRMPATLFMAQDDAPPVHAAAVEHSHAYETRAKIHKLASWATIPLFATELALGQSLYSDSANANARRSAHGVVGAGIAGLFAVNTVTGAWNLFGEGRHERQGRTLRWVHAVMMMVADAGFVATSMSAPDSESGRHALTFQADKSTHRNLAVASIGVGTASYLLMLFGNH